MSEPSWSTCRTSVAVSKIDYYFFFSKKMKLAKNYKAETRAESTRGKDTTLTGCRVRVRVGFGIEMRWGQVGWIEYVDKKMFTLWHKKKFFFSRLSPRSRESTLYRRNSLAKSKLKLPSTSPASLLNVGEKLKNNHVAKFKYRGPAKRTAKNKRSRSLFPLQWPYTTLSSICLVRYNTWDISNVA